LKATFFEIQNGGLKGFAENGNKHPPIMQTCIF